MMTIARFATLLAALFYLAMPLTAGPVVLSAHDGAGPHSAQPASHGGHHAMATGADADGHGCCQHAKTSGPSGHCSSCLAPLPQAAAAPAVALVRGAPPPAEARQPAALFPAPLDPPPWA